LLQENKWLPKNSRIQAKIYNKEMVMFAGFMLLLALGILALIITELKLTSD